MNSNLNDKQVAKGGWISLSFAALLIGTATASASKSGEPAPAATRGNIEWVIEPPSEVRPQTEAEKKAAQQNGRALPTPELLQPELDPALMPYKAKQGLAITARLKVGTSDILPSLVKAWVAGFQKHHPGFSLEIDKPMAGSLGTLELIEGEVDLVFVSRELKPTDISSFRAKFGYDPLSLPISGGTYRHFGFLDAMVFMVHRDNPIERLSFDQLDSILSSTRLRGGAAIRTWGDLGLDGEWAARPINVYGIKPWNGFEEFIRQRVLSFEGSRGEWRPDMHFDPVFFPVARRVAADPNGIGYTGLSVVDSPVRVIQVGVDRDGPFHAPTYEAVASGEYPLSRLVYLNTNRKPGETLDPALEEFLRFVLSSDGQRIVRDHQIFLPLRAPQVHASLELLELPAASQ